MIEAYGSSDIGRKRQRNEDSYAVNQEIHLYIVADGMGGHNAGDVASATAVKAIRGILDSNASGKGAQRPFGIDPKIFI